MPKTGPMIVSWHCQIRKFSNTSPPSRSRRKEIRRHTTVDGIAEGGCAQAADYFRREFPDPTKAMSYVTGFDPLTRLGSAVRRQNPTAGAEGIPVTSCCPGPDSTTCRSLPDCKVPAGRSIPAAPFPVPRVHTAPLSSVCAIDSTFFVQISPPVR